MASGYAVPAYPYVIFDGDNLTEVQGLISSNAGNPQGVTFSDPEYDGNGAVSFTLRFSGEDFDYPIHAEVGDAVIANGPGSVIPGDEFAQRWIVKE